MHKVNSISKYLLSCLFTNMYFGPPVTGTNDEEKAEIAWAVFYFRKVNIVFSYPLKLPYEMNTLLISNISEVSRIGNQIKLNIKILQITQI